MPIEPLGLALFIIARNAIVQRFGQPVRTVVPHPELSHPAATFVTLTQNRQLRGCIGSLEATRPLATDVAENAVAAAFRDARFTPLSGAETTLTRIEVSLLGPAEPIAFSNEAEAIDRLCPGVDGLSLAHGGRRATFLPQVWESLPDPRQFLAELKRKAGLPADFRDKEITLSRYSVRKWKET